MKDVRFDFRLFVDEERIDSVTKEVRNKNSSNMRID